MPEGYAQQWYQDALEKDIRWAKITNMRYNQLVKHQHGIWQDIFMQDWRGEYTHADAYVFAKLITLLYEGEIAYKFIDTIDEPCRDKDIKGNQKILDNLPEPFKGKFEGGYGDDDGWLEWNKSVFLVSKKLYRNKNEVKEEIWHNILQYWNGRLGPDRASLEVGTTNAETTYMHLCKPQPLARFPYGHKKICLMKGLWYRKAFLKKMNRIFGFLEQKKPVDISCSSVII